MPRRIAFRDRHQDNLEWKLHPVVFRWLSQSYCIQSMDLFASRLNYQIPNYAFWKPDPGATAIDAFFLNWEGTKPYLFPPFNLIGRVLKKLRHNHVVDAILIAPWWPNSALVPATVTSPVRPTTSTAAMEPAPTAYRGPQQTTGLPRGVSQLSTQR